MQQRQCKYGNDCRRNQMGQCNFYHPQIPSQNFMNQNQPTRQCKYGNNCHKNQMGQCTFLHSQQVTQESMNPNQPQRQCKYGNDCRKNQIGQCLFSHPQTRQARQQNMNQNQRQCKYGNNCRRHQIGQCPFSHPQQQINQGNHTRKIESYNNQGYQKNYSIQNQTNQDFQGNRQNQRNQDNSLCRNYHFGECTNTNCNRYHGFIPQSDVIRRIQRMTTLPVKLTSKLFKFQINGKNYYSMRNDYDLNLFDYNLQTKAISSLYNWSLPDLKSKYNYFEQKNENIFFSRENPDSTYDDICFCSIQDWKTIVVCNAHTSKVTGMVKYLENYFISTSLSGQLKVWLKQNENLINKAQIANSLRLKIAPLNVNISFYFLDLVKVMDNTTLVVGTNDGRAILFIGDNFETFYPINLGQIHSLVFKIKFFSKDQNPYALILTYTADQTKSAIHCYSFNENQSVIVVQANHLNNKFAAIRSFEVFENYIFVITLGGTVNIYQWKEKETFFNKIGCIMHQNLVSDIVFAEQQIKTTSVKLKYMMILQSKTKQRQGSFGVYLIK